MELTLGTTIEHCNFRIHRYANSVKATDLTNANKRGKKCNEYVIYEHRVSESETLTFFNSLANMLEECETPKAVEKVMQVYAEGTKFNYQHRELRGVDVAPSVAKFAPVSFESEHVSVNLDWDSFSIRDKKDRVNEPVIVSNGTKTNARKFHKMWSENKERFEAMTFQQIHSLFTSQDYTIKAYIKFHYYCAMD